MLSTVNSKATTNHANTVECMISVDSKESTNNTEECMMLFSVDAANYVINTGPIYTETLAEYHHRCGLAWLFNRGARGPGSIPGKPPFFGVSIKNEIG